MKKEQLAIIFLNITGEENALTKADMLKELEWQLARELCRVPQQA